MEMELENTTRPVDPEPEVKRTRFRWRTLLVESNAVEAARLQEKLMASETEFAVEVAEDLDTALRRLARGGLDAVLLNLHLADSRGLSGLIRLRASFAQPKIVALTERANEMLDTEAGRQGAVACIPSDKLDGYWLAHLLRSADEREVAQERMQGVLSFYRSVVEHLPHGIFRKDARGRFNFVNAWFCRLVGLPQQELIGRKSGDLFPEHRIEKYAAQDEHVLQTGQPFEGLEELNTPDGRHLFVHISKTAITERTGRILGLQGLVLDVTEQAKAEEAVRTSQHVLQSILDNSTAVIYVKDLEGRYLLINREYETLFQVSREQVLGRSDRELFPADVATAFRAHDEQVLQARTPLQFEEIAPAHDGPHNYISIKFPLVSPAGDPYAVCGISTDITDRKRAQQALQESQERLALMIQGSNDGVWDWNVATNEVYFSPRWKGMLGYEDAEIENRFSSWENLLHPDDRTGAMAAVQDYFSGRSTSYELEHRLRHKDGSYRWILARGVALRNAHGQPLRMAGSHVDLTERKRAEQRLLTHYAVTRVLAEAGSLREAAPRLLQAVCESLGWDYGEVWLFDPQNEVLRCFGLWHLPTVALRELGLASQQHTFAAGASLPGEVWAQRQPVWIADVSEHSELSRFPLLRQAGLRGALGFPLCFGGEFVGVMDFFSPEIRRPDAELLQMFANLESQVGQFVLRKRSEEARSRLSAIVESSEDAIFSETLDGLITTWNPGAQKMFGYTAEEVVGRLSAILVPPDQAAETAALREKIRRLEPVNHFETTRISKRGKAIPVSLTVSPIRDGAGRVTGMSSIARNINERRRAEEKLRASAAHLAQSNRDLEDFAFVASHDLQEPLGKVQSFVDLLERECDGVLSEKGLDYLRRLRKATVHMQALIRGLLTFSRVQTEGQPFVPVDLNAVIQDVLSDLETRIQKADARLEVGTLGTIEGDPTQLRQLFQNLIGNALKFVHPERPPAIQVQAQRVWERTASSGLPQEMCRLTVADNGIGIEEKYIKRLFNMFQRLRPQAYEGTGIGLAICRRIAQRHGGSIAVQSEPGRGSTFRVTVPVRQRRGDTTV